MVNVEAMIQHLRRERDLIDAAIAALVKIYDASTSNPEPPPSPKLKPPDKPKRGKRSEADREKMRLAQAARRQREREAKTAREDPFADLRRTADEQLTPLDRPVLPPLRLHEDA